MADVELRSVIIESEPGTALQPHSKSPPHQSRSINSTAQRRWSCRRRNGEGARDGATVENLQMVLHDEEEEEMGMDDEQIESIMASRRRERYDIDNGAPYFRIGMTFRSMEEARFAVDDYSVNGGYDIRIIKSDKTRLRVRCEACPFYLLVSRDGECPTVVVKTIVHVHDCYTIYSNKRATVKWLAAKFMDRVLERPNYSSSDMKSDAKSINKVNVSLAKCIRARQMILEQLDSSYKQEYATLEAYASECMHSNPGSFLKVDLDSEALREGNRVFSRIFVCFNALKKGWKAGCRPMIGLDGCFLKGICKGVLLAACGRDANNHFYPIAWAIVDKENGENWYWFIQHLKAQLQIENGENLTIISDMQKGLLDSVKGLLPESEHRWCARHIHANWSKKWRGGELTKWFWICSWSTYQEEFKDNLKKLGSISKEAAEHLVSYPPQKWCRAYYSSRSKDMNVTSNHVESFNAWIKIPREKSIYRLLDGIRLEVMEKLAECDKEASKWKKEWSPKCLKVFDVNSQIAMRCRVDWNGEDGFEVSEGQDKHCVKLESKLCTCREWELSGIPCPHAICALRHKKCDPRNEISMYYHISTFKETYSFKLQPIRGKTFWNIDMFAPILPPPIVKMPGRPKKKRIREATEPDRQSQTQKLTKKGHQKKCSKCGAYGHNKVRCTGANPPPPTGTSGTGLSRHPSVLNSDQQYQDLTNRFYESIRERHNLISRVQEPTNESQLDVEVDPVEVAVRFLVEELDPEVIFPIPSEEETRMERRTMDRDISGTRRIPFFGDGYDTLIPTDLPFEGRKLMWNGQRAITTNSLRAEQEKRIGKQTEKK